MGRGPRRKPARLPGKLRAIRDTLLMSQDEIIVRMGLKGEYLREEISAFELGKRPVPLPLLLNYADLANIYVEVLINDNLDLPEKLPASPRSEGIPHTPQPKPRSPKRS